LRCRHRSDGLAAHSTKALFEETTLVSAASSCEEKAAHATSENRSAGLVVTVEAGDKVLASA
jgi:hypothetical protein